MKRLIIGKQYAVDSRQKTVKRMPINSSLSTVYCLVLVLFLLIGCAGMKGERKKASASVERYRVALFNGGAYRALYDQAAMDLGGFREVILITGTELDSILGNSGKSPRDLMEALSFDDVAKIQSLDFALILQQAPAAYTMGSVGLRSINWRTKTLKTIPAMKVPERPTDWLLETRNGWARFTSDPPGAAVILNDKLIGTTPLLVMLDNIRYKAVFHWTPKYSRVVDVDLDARNWVHARAPEEYLAKHQKKGFYSRLQDSDEKHGEATFMVFYLIIFFGGIALLFYNPFR